MEKETIKLIETLANKLGTTSQYLWGILVKQAPVDATITLMQIIIVAIAGIALYKTHKRLCQKPKNDNYNDSWYEKSDGVLPAIMVVLAVIWGVLAICCFFAINDIFNGYFNPEYWALNYLMEKL